MFRAVPLSLLLASPQVWAQAIHSVGPGGFADIPSAVGAAADGDIIEVAPGDWSTELDLFDRTLTIRSTGGSGVTRIVDGGGTVMLAAYGSTVTYEGFTFAPTGMRALVVADLGYGPSVVTLKDVVFEGATIAPSDAWYPMGSSLYVDEGSSAFLEDVVFASATPLGNAGGHLGVRLSTIEAVRTTFIGTSTTNGGSVYLENSTGTFTDCDFVGGSVSGAYDANGYDIASGGALLSITSTLDLVDTTFTGATAPYVAGAAYVLFGTVDIVGGGFYDNSASYGGGLFCNYADCTVDGTSFERNFASVLGGAIGVWPNATATITNARICDNEADAGGGILLIDAELTLTSSVLCGNVASDWGAALGADIFAGSSLVTSRNNSFVGNTATNQGGAMAADLATIDSTNDLFLDNTTAAGQTALDAYNGTGIVSVSHALFFGNTGTTDATLDATTILGADPLLASWMPGDCALSDLSPLWGSPVIDNGDPGWLDPDGSVSDIGAFGGEGADDDFWVDTDGDLTIDAWDCAPADPALHPYADETCAGAGVDEDCDGLVDSDDPGVTDLQSVYLDLDLDGFGEPSLSLQACPGPGLVTNGSDCDDTDPDAWPGAPEVPADGIDQDCDGSDLEPVDTGSPGPGDTGAPDTGAGPIDTDPEPGADPSSGRLPPAPVDESAPGTGCGCDAVGGPGPWVLVALLICARRRARP